MPTLLIFITELTVLLQTILIHSGAGAFGQASTAFPQQRGAPVYTTVSTEEKKDYLLSELVCHERTSSSPEISRL